MIGIRKIWVGGLIALAAAPTFADRPANNFPEFAAHPESVERIAIVVDALFTVDLPGSRPHGIHVSDAMMLLPALIAEVKGGVEDRGFKVTEIHGNSGLMMKRDPNLVYIEHGQNTERAVEFPIYDKSPPYWATTPMRAMMSDIWPKYYVRNRTIGPIDTVVGDDLKRLPADAIMMISLASREAGFATRLAGASLTSLVGPASGFFSEYFYPGGTVLITLVDVRSGKVIWHDRRQRKGKGTIGGMAQLYSPLRQMIQLMPNRNNPPNPGMADSFREGTELENGVTTWAGKRWTGRDGRRALAASQITKEQLSEFRRQHVLNYRKATEANEANLKAGKLDKRTFEIEELRLQWAYN